MDTAVGIVNAYLELNGYMTVTEFPLIEWKHGQSRMATDLDVIAFRFPDAGREIRSRARMISAPVSFEPDAALGGTPGKPDMIVGEVKEGNAEFNLAVNDPLVLASGLSRFGCCAPDDSKELAQRLIRSGRAESPHGHTIRMVAFGSRVEAPAQWHSISIRHVFEFIENYLDEHWSSLRHADLKDRTLSLMALNRKARGAAGKERSS